MVTRKPVPATAGHHLPYPTSPTFTTSQTLRNSLNPEPKTPSDDENDEQDAWEAERQQNIPQSLRAGTMPQGAHRSQKTPPESLRAGPAQYTPRSSAELQRPMADFNPYYNSNQPTYENGGNPWQAPEKVPPPPPSQAPPPPPVPQAPPNPRPNDPVKNMFTSEPISDTPTNPWQPALDAKKPAAQQSFPDLHRQDSGNDIWSSEPPPNRPPPSMSTAEPHGPVVINDESESPAWDEDESPTISDMQANIIPFMEDTHEEEHAWEDANADRDRLDAANRAQKVAQEDQIRQEAGWDSAAGLPPQESGVVGSDGVDLTPHLPPRPSDEEAGPTLPPRPVEDEQPPQEPSRPCLDQANRSEASLGSSARKQRKETYEIRKFLWFDAKASENPRSSPMLVQNVNGPCPLLALVNALVLSTPANLNTPLVEALQTREQISLLLLLDAVIDELMSGRRVGEDQELPDVIELHYFLLDLHTGMNVNPRFFPAPPSRNNDIRRSMIHVHPSEREDSIPGTFEETHEVTLYNAFSIPLIHGWLPRKESAARAALKRSAATYEDVQNLQFREEELENKLQAEGLSFEEQSTYEDLAIINSFLNESATQLTQFGIETIIKSLQPGTFAILFRNNHFSTLYRHPENMQLFTLVTDHGYATHDEVIWESLDDVNGEHCEFFSGDFLVVGGVSSSPHRSNSSSAGLQAAQSHRRGSRNRSSISLNSPGARRRSMNSSVAEETSSTERIVETSDLPIAVTSPNTEQEDHDLALALQMQDEEDRMHEEEQARRERETRLSQQFIEQQAGSGAARAQQIPVSTVSSQGRRNTLSQAGSAELRPSIPPRRNNIPQQQAADPEAGVELPPPSYEQAATEPAYVPNPNGPEYPTANPVRAGSIMHQRRSSINISSQAAHTNGQTAAARPLLDRIPARRQSQNITAQMQQPKDKDCIVM